MTASCNSATNITGSAFPTHSPQSPQPATPMSFKDKEIPFTALLNVTKFLSAKEGFFFAATSKKAHHIFSYRIRDVVDELQTTITKRPYLPNIFRLLPDRKVTLENPEECVEIFRGIVKIHRAFQECLSNPQRAGSTKVEEAKTQLVSIKKDPFPIKAEDIESLFRENVYTLVGRTEKIDTARRGLFIQKCSWLPLLESIEKINTLTLSTQLKEQAETRPYVSSSIQSAIAALSLMEQAESDSTSENRALENISAVSDPFLKALLLVRWTLRYSISENKDQTLQNLLADSDIETKVFCLMIWERLYPTSENEDPALQAFLTLPDVSAKAEMLMVWIKWHPTPENSKIALEAILDLIKEQKGYTKSLPLILDLLKIFPTPENKKAARESILAVKCPEWALEWLKIDPTPENSEIVQEITKKFSIGSKVEESWKTRNLANQVEFLISKKMILEALKAISAMEPSNKKSDLLIQVFDLAW